MSRGSRPAGVPSGRRTAEARTGARPRSTRKRGAGARAAAAIVVLAGSLCAAGAAETVRLRYGLRPGAAYEQVTTLGLAIGVEMQGVPPEAAGMMGAMMKDLRQDLRMTLLMEVGAEADDGSAPVTGRLTEAALTMTMAGQPMDLGGASGVVGREIFRARRTRDGRLADVRVEGAEGLSSDITDRLLRAMPELPDREMAIGDSFTVPILFGAPVPGGGGDLRVEGNTAFVLRAIRDGEALFDVTQRLSLAAGGDGDAPGPDLRLDGGGRGAAVFDLREGIFRSLRLELEMAVDTAIGAGAEHEAVGDEAAEASAPGEAAAPPARARLHLRMTGPMEVTTSRRSAPVDPAR